jgi:membrane protein
MMASVSNSGTPVIETATADPGPAPNAGDAHSQSGAGTSIQIASTVDAVEHPTRSKWYRWRTEGKAVIDYLLDSEVHTFAFSVAANAIISFIPFVVLLYTLAQSVFHSAPNGAMVRIINQMVVYFLPSATKDPNWLVKNMQAAAALSSRHGVQIFSLVVILISCTGIFLPLEVALNQAWGVAKSRNYIYNQVIAFGLALIMAVLGMASILINEAVQGALAVAFFGHTQNILFQSLSYLWLAATTGVACIVFFFFIYWLLPNRKVPWRPVMRTAMVTGVAWLGARLVFVAVLPHLDLRTVYGPFFVSVGLLFWAYISGLILFAGAQFSVSRLGGKKS